MLNRDELKSVTAAVGAEATIGTAVLQNMRRFIYRIRFVNGAVGVNTLLVGKRENGAGATTNLDTIQTVVPNEMVTDPDEFKEDSAPLYVIDGPPGNVAVAVGFLSLVRMATGGGAGAPGIVTYWYVDEPA
jgi:hypothetical protein